MIGKSAKACTKFINDEDGSPILDPEVAANTFNNFFASVHKTLSSETNINYVSENSDLNNIKDRVKVKLARSPEFSISMVTESFILKDLQNLKINKATGTDGINAKYLKVSAPVNSKHLAAILNLSIQSNSYPGALKKAKVTPIFKKGKKRTSINTDLSLSCP